MLPILLVFRFFFFFFNDTATTEIYTLSLHDALPIHPDTPTTCLWSFIARAGDYRSEEHTSELQSRSDLVCRLLLEKKKKKNKKLRSNKNKKIKQKTKKNRKEQ